jgi:translation initiation factor 2B subunit (eIF-2B alpha/beta/delta family)
MIIWPENGEIGEHDFDPSPEEAMYLLSGVWLHDIGMWHGIFDSDHPDELGDTRRVVKLRREHELRTARYIIDKWGKGHNWSDDERTLLSNICVFHRRHHPIKSFDPYKTKGRYADEAVRFAILAALLRLADACHVDKSRAPAPVMRLYMSLGMPKDAACHWKKAELIREVSFDHVSREVVLTAHYPPKVDFDLGEFDLGEVGEIVCRNVEEELRSVQQILLPYRNTSFWEVKHDRHYITALGSRQRRQCLALWPYLLSKPCSASEAAAALVKMLLLGTEEGEEGRNLGGAWRRKVFQIMNNSEKSRPVDFMIRNLCISVEKLLSKLAENAKSANKLKRYLKRFMKSIEKNSEKLVGHALRVIGHDDVLVLYGHSRNIVLLLKNIDKKHSLYIVDCYRPLDGHQVLDENKKIIRSVENSGFANKYRFLQLESLAEALGELKRKKAPCKVLLGTHGRLKNGDLLCKVGSHIIAATAKRFGAEVVAFCEKAKFLVNSIKDDQIAGADKIFSSEDEKLHPQLLNVPYVAPKMDRVPKTLVDVVITEERVERRRKPAKRVAGTGKARSKGRKANKAK